MGGLVEFAVHLVITAALLLLVAHIARGIHVDNWGSAFIAALVLGLVNAFVRPLIVVLTLPLTVVTLGLFLLVINALMLQLTAAITPGIRVEGCGSALIGSLLLSLLNMAVYMIVG